MKTKALGFGKEIVDLQQKHAWFRSEESIGQTVEVLVEKVSKNQQKNSLKKQIRRV
jgi:predicted site-specific integrase-resolvase